MSGRTGWVDASGGISGDMLLGACVDAGVDLALIQAAVDGLDLPERIELTAAPARRGSLGGTRVLVSAEASRVRRGLADVRSLLEGAAPGIRASAVAVFEALAAAEAQVHQIDVEEVHFHEVGALDAIADVVGVVAGLDALGLDRLVCSPIALGGGQARTEHGPIPVPGPAVLELLRAARVPGASGFGGPVPIELATPTGVALMVTLADEFGPLPALSPELVGVGAGGKDPADHANITRLVVGETTAAGGASGTEEAALVLEANVDDLDPRLWPQVLVELLAAGASDAWLTPILMKKGRPAHTVSVLAEPARADRLERILLTHTSTIGLRRHPVTKRALPREEVVVEVPGGRVRVKVARLDGVAVNAEPEYDDVARVAARSGIAPKVVLQAARAAADGLLSR